MTRTLSASAQRVQDAVVALGFRCQVLELSQTTRSATEAAAAIGCRIDQIAKSLVFRRRQSQRPILVIASGANRVNEKRIEHLIGEPVDKPDAEFVRKHTGFAIGGVPPVGFPEKLEVFIDEDLMRHSEIWAAAGTPSAVFRLTPAQLAEMTAGQIVSIK